MPYPINEDELVPLFTQFEGEELREELHFLVSMSSWEEIPEAEIEKTIDDILNQFS